MRIRVSSHTVSEALQPSSLEGFAYQIDPYVGCEHACCYCYAQNRGGVAWGEEVAVYRGLVEALERQLSAIAPQTIYVGMNTDPYQPVELEERQTRKVLELLARRGFSACVLTKSGMVIRDIDLFRAMPGSSVGFSIAFHEEETRRLFEEAAPSNDERFLALETLKKAGIETYVLVCPVMPPPIADVGPIIDTVAPLADTVWFYRLAANSEADPSWRRLKAVLDEYFPEATEMCRQAALSPDHPYWHELRARLERVKSERGLKMRIEL